MASEESHNIKPPSEQSTTELIASAKLVAEAAQSALKRESDKVDKAKLADAAGDLLDAAGKYAKLDDKQGIGQYVDKAADYLHNYQGGGGGAPSQPAESKGEESGGGGGGGGLGGLANLAGGFFKK
ncbi:hypothetical protein AAZX31_20G024900 [Glycine max]|uniref:Nodulin-related protein 1 n=1 Tax=Glycine max TaxID=3847 RepID=I1NDJ4_SOYBN|nr:nodulin-related protein 1 [Glycine max]KAG4906413.1 hypothetical protein JHK86_054897 [Glycine max]KAG5073693.1 hypothetical protein JHK84_054924 [Glycine max]KRG89504.1 hypothetical protein GLYMA_20G027200v4 [Glycine max]|eukprot:XP_003556680.1 nodulin-related protein 1 [Glycine max]